MCVRLLALDEENVVLLRSYAYPTFLKSFFPDRDDDAVLCAVNVMKTIALQKASRGRISYNYKVVEFSKRSQHHLEAVYR